MPSWFIFTLCAIFVLAVAELAQKLSLIQKENISAEANNFLVWIIQGLIAFLFIIIFRIPVSLDINIQLLIKLFALGSLYFWAGTLYYSSYKGESVGVSVILVTISTVISTTLGIIFLNEIAYFLKFLGIILIILSIILLRYSKKDRLNKYNILALAGGLLYGIAYTLDKSFVIQLDAHIYHIVFCFIIGLCSLLYKPRIIIMDIRKLKFKNLIPIFISAITFFLFNKFTFLSYSRGGEVGKVDAINNASIFLIILLEIIVLKERKFLTKKIITAIISFIGIIILGFS